MAQQRPPAVTAMGVLNLVIGGMGLFGLCVGGLVALFLVVIFLNIPAPRPGQPAPQDQMGGLFRTFDQEAPAAKYLLLAAVVVGAVMSLVLTAAGVGLLRMCRWGRTWSLAYAVVMLIYGPAATVYSAVELTPRWMNLSHRLKEQEARRRNAPPPRRLMFGPTYNASMAVIGSVGNSLYPIALLIVLNLRHVRAAFARPGDRDDRDEPIPEVHPCPPSGPPA
jgi:hypothetical protein